MSTALGRARRSWWRALLPWTLSGATVAAQILYPLVRGSTRRSLTSTTVTLFFGASVSHAALTRGRPWTAGLVGAAGGVGLLAEAVGTRSGFPFGRYAYTESLGTRVLGVPVIVPMAWTMMAYPALLVARRLSGGSGARTVLLGAYALTAWDVFLDPQMVEEGHWAWEHPTPALPGVPGIPLSNYAGWLGVSTLIMTLLDRLPDAVGDTRDGAPAALFLWTYTGSVVGNVVFFGRPRVGVVGGLLLGAVAFPYARALWRSR